MVINVLVPTENLIHEEQSLLASSRQVLNLDEREPLLITPILKGGSDRHFFRLKGTAGKSWIVSHYGLERRENSLFADIAVFPWIRNLVGFYEAGDLVQFERFANVRRVLDAFLARPAVQRGLNIPARG